MNIPHELEQWRKGVDLIRVPLVKFAGKKLPTLSCVDISRAVLEVIAEVDSLKAQLAAANAQRDELLRDISAAVQTLREVNERSARPDEKRGFCSSAFCNGNHHDSACEGDYLTSRWIESMSASIARAQSGQPARDWPEDAAHENGQYQCICATCGASFVGHKRRVQCKACAQSEQPAQRDDDPSKHDDHCNCERCR